MADYIKLAEATLQMFKNCSISDFEAKLENLGGLKEEYELIMEMLNDAIDNDHRHSKIDYGSELYTFVIDHMYLMDE